MSDRRQDPAPHLANMDGQIFPRFQKPCVLQRSDIRQIKTDITVIVSSILASKPSRGIESISKRGSRKLPRKLAIDLQTVISYLNAVSALAVTLGVFFVIFQLRQNAKLIEASNKQIETANRQVEANLQQNIQQVILSTVDRFTDETFFRKRKLVRDIVRKYQENGWKDFIESDGDYEIRGFLGLYDSTGWLAKSGIANVGMLTEGMGYLVNYDWEATEPAIKQYALAWGRDVYPNFRWLRDAVKSQFEKQGVSLPSRLQ